MELTKQVQQLQLQIWMLNDQCDHLQNENRDLRLAIDMMRTPTTGSDNRAYSPAQISHDSDADVVRKVSMEGSYLLQTPSVNNSRGIGLTRQASFGGEAAACMSTLPTTQANGEMESGKDTKNWTISNPEDGLHVIASLATSVLKPKPLSEEDGVTTLYRTLSRSLEESNQMLIHKWQNQDNTLKRQKTLP
jgi:hypothetical protein